MYTERGPSPTFEPVHVDVSTAYVTCRSADVSEKQDKAVYRETTTTTVAPSGYHLLEETGPGQWLAMTKGSYYLSMRRVVNGRTIERREFEYTPYAVGNSDKIQMY